VDRSVNKHPRPPAAAMLLALGLAILPLARAQAQLGTTDNSVPVNIQSDSGIEWQQNQQVYIARGNALATRGPATIKADTLIAHYREARPGTANAGSNTEIYRVEALGNVVITRDTRTVVGDRADYDIDQGIGIVTGKALKMTSLTDTVTARDALEWYDTKDIAVARGDAVAVHNGRTIKGDILTAYMVKTAPPGQPPAPGQAPPAKPSPASTAPAPTKPAPATPAKTPTKPSAAPEKPGANPAASNEASKISRVDAQGHVVVIGAADIGHGDYGVYNAETGICTLLGNVVITRGKDIITGQYAVMDMNRNISRILPASTLPDSTRQRVQGVFVKQDMNPGQGGTPKPGQPASPVKPTEPPSPGKTP
jgi:lipopolysaccharide export system protein LptA